MRSGSLFALILAISAIILLPFGSSKIGNYGQALAATKTISGSITISGGGAYTGSGVVTVTNVNSGGTATGSVIGGRYSVGGLTAPGSQTYRVFLSPIPGYTILSNNIQTTFSSGTSTVNFIIRKNTPTPTKKPPPTPTKKPAATPTKKPNPTATPVANTKITLCVYRNGTTTPIQGAKITITGYSTVTVGSNGCYVYTFVRGRTITAKAEASGYVSQTKNISLTAATQQQNFSLSSTSSSTPTPTSTSNSSKSIKGTVVIVDATGETLQPLTTQTSVLLTNTSTQDTKLVNTNSSGAFSFTGLAGGTQSYQVLLNVPSGYQGVVTRHDVTLNTGEQRTLPAFKVRRTTTVSPSPSATKTINGTVRALNSSGSEINYPGGGTITVTNLNSGTTKTVNVTASSTGNGTYTASGLTTPGSQSYKVNLSPPSGYTVSSGQNQTVGPFSEGSRTANFTVRQNAPTSIPPGTRYIEGNVYTQTGSGAITGIGGVSVTIKNIDSTDAGTVVITDSGGRFIRTGLVGNNYRVSVAVPSGYSLLSSNNQQVSLGSGGSTSVSFRLAPPGTSTSTSLNICVSENGGPAITGAKIAIEGRTTETVGTNGCRSYTFLVGSILKVTASATGYVSQTVTIALNSATTRNFFLSRDNSNSFSISGTVTSSVDNKPIGGIRIQAGFESSGQLFAYNDDTTGSDGKYQIITPLTGPLTLRAIPSASSPYQGSISNPTITFNASSVKSVTRNFRLTPKTTPGELTNGSISVSIYEDKDKDGTRDSNELLLNKPATIFLYRVSGSTLTPISTRDTKIGQAIFNSLNSGSYKVGLSVPAGYRANSTTSNNLSLSSSNPSATVAFGVYPQTPSPSTASSMGVIYGRVKDQKGYPVGNVNVVVSRGSLVITQTNTNANGYYITRTLPYASNYSVIFGLGCFRTNTYSPLNLNANVVGLNRTLERIVSPSCSAPTGQVPDDAPIPPDYPDPDDGYTAPEDPDSEVPPLDPDDPYPTEAPTPTAKPTATNTPSPTRTPTPSPTKTPTPTLSAPSGTSSPATPTPSVNEPTISPTSSSPTSSPTIGPSTTATPQPTGTPIATPTPIPDSVFVTFDATLDGIGSGGDRQNPTSSALSNKTPLNPSRTVLVEVFNNNEEKIKEASGIMTYNASTGTFSGSANLGSELASGNYLVKIKTPQFLRANFRGITSLTKGNESNTLPPVTLIAGDVNGDNVLNILDYNFILGCYSDLAEAKSCTPSQKIATDLNDDGKVNQVDYNLFLRELSSQTGD